MDIQELLEILHRQQAGWRALQDRHQACHTIIRSNVLRITEGLQKIEESVQAAGGSQERTDEMVTLLARKLLDLSAIVERRTSRES